jgi:hypothetical protein
MAGSKKSTLSFRTALNNLVIYKKNKTTTRGKCVATLLQAFPTKKNKYMKKSIISMLLFMVAMIAAAKDLKTAVFTTTPQMHCENCENKIKGNLRFEKGVKVIKTDIEAQKVFVTYDPKKTTEEKLQKAFEKFGYKAEKTDKDAKIPVHGDEQCENM